MQDWAWSRSLIRRCTTCCHRFPSGTAPCRSPTRGSGCRTQERVSHPTQAEAKAKETAHALEVFHDDVVRRDVHLRAGRVAAVLEAERSRRGDPGRRELRRAVHVDVVVVVRVREVRHGPAGGDGAAGVVNSMSRWGRWRWRRKAYLKTAAGTCVGRVRELWEIHGEYKRGRTYGSDTKRFRG